VHSPLLEAKFGKLSMINRCLQQGISSEISVSVCMHTCLPVVHQFQHIHSENSSKMLQIDILFLVLSPVSII
jgi:hypothetical protein